MILVQRGTGVLSQFEIPAIIILNHIGI